MQPNTQCSLCLGEGDVKIYRAAVRWEEGVMSGPVWSRARATLLGAATFTTQTHSVLALQDWEADISQFGKREKKIQVEKS